MGARMSHPGLRPLIFSLMLFVMRVVRNQVHAFLEPVVLYECKTSFLILRDQNRLMVTENSLRCWGDCLDVEGRSGKCLEKIA
jgi:hypothetical protein